MCQDNSCPYCGQPLPANFQRKRIKGLSVKDKLKKPRKRAETPVVTTLWGQAPVTAPTKKTGMNRFIEFWNTLPHVPKCKKGTKSYTSACKFLEQFRRFEVGSPPFLFTSEVAKKLNIKKINKIPPNVSRRGPTQVPVRRDDEIFEALATAALVYDPQYAPLNKKVLPGTLFGFLYNAYSKGLISMFLSKLELCPPLLLDAGRLDELEQQTPDWKLDIVEIVRGLYIYANRKPEDYELSLEEFKIALNVTNRIISRYEKIPTNQYHTLLHHFPNHTEFVEWWRGYCQEHVWQGMPIQALLPGKAMWNKFVDFVNADLGRDIFTGERI